MRFEKLSSYEYYRIEETLSTRFPLIQAVISGSQSGSIFVDGDQNILIIHKSGFGFLHAQNSESFLGIWDFIVTSIEIPTYFHIYAPPIGFELLPERYTPSVKINSRIRIQLKYTKTFIDEMIIPSSESDIYYFPIGESDLTLISSLDISIERKFWNSKEDFLRNGFGFYAKNKVGVPVSICYSACVSSGAAEIDVATLTNYQGLGIAKKLVTQFVRYCIEHDLVPNWDCFSTNTASLSTATSLGFEEVFHYSFLSIFKTDIKA